MTASLSMVIGTHHVAQQQTMTSTDFAQAQARIAARRRQRSVETLNKTSPQTSRVSEAILRLPAPIGQVLETGAATWESIRGREGTRPAFRVGQVDAELLDEELLELLKGQVRDALKYYGSHLCNDWSAEISLALRAALFKLTIWDHDASYGAALQNLRYTDARDRSLARGPRKYGKRVYTACSVLVVAMLG